MRTPSVTALLLCACLPLMSTPLSGAEGGEGSGWISLFNGKDLSGWKQLGGAAEYEVDNGTILGISKPTNQNTFLVTDETYGDFVLELEFKLDSKTNSGIQVRSEAKEGVAGGRVHGYQIEFDPSPRAWTGGLYDESRRGWLYPLGVNPPAQEAYLSEEWNHLRIECIGPHIRSWLNGVPATYLIDDMTAQGFIGLQVHAPFGDVMQEDQRVWWRDIRIQTAESLGRPLEPADRGDAPFVVHTAPNELSEAEAALGWELLFDGKTTRGWRPVHGTGAPNDRWSVKDGMLVVGGSSSYAKGQDIVTEREFGAFELQLEFRMSEGANSGIKYPVTEEHHPGSNHGIGLEYQILDDARHPDAQGERGELRTLASLYDLIAAEKQGRFVKGPGMWNHARIVMKLDGTVEHWLNHLLVLSFDRSSPDFADLVAGSKYQKYEGFGTWPRGRILLQDHGDLVEFRSIKVRELSQ